MLYLLAYQCRVSYDKKDFGKLVTLYPGQYSAYNNII